MTNKILIKDRAIIEIKGPDNKNFLQGLITNDINKTDDGSLIYAAMLNPQGRFLYDFFIFQKDSSLFLDCFAARRDEIFKKLNFYKLRMEVEIFKNDEYKILFCEKNPNDNEALTFNDPRHNDFGFRIYNKNFSATQNNEEYQYHYRRICFKIAEGEHDLTYEKSIIGEFNFDNLNAIDYKKGCYVGQELTARTHYLGEIRKQIFHITIENLHEIAKNSEIFAEGKNTGIVLSSVYYENKLHGLALIKNFDQGQNFEIEKNKINILTQ